MTIQERLVTAADLAALPDDGRRYELVRGELIEMPPTKRVHGLIVSAISAFIFNYARVHDLGEIVDNSGYRLTEDPDTVRAPDVAFTTKARIVPLTEEYDRVVPDLAIEVVSPGNSADDLYDKTLDYFEAGVRCVWLVYPKQQAVHVYSSPKDVRVFDVNDTLDGGDILPGFTLGVREIFAVLPGSAEHQSESAL